MSVMFLHLANYVKSSAFVLRVPPLFFTSNGVKTVTNNCFALQECPTSLFFFVKLSLAKTILTLPPHRTVSCRAFDFFLFRRFHGIFVLHLTESNCNA